MQLRRSFFQVVRFKPTQKRIQAPDCCRELPTILDPSSSSQIHLWNKSQISNSSTARATRRLGRLDGSTARRLAIAPVWPPSQISNRLTILAQIHNCPAAGIHPSVTDRNAQVQSVLAASILYGISSTNQRRPAPLG